MNRAHLKLSRISLSLIGLCLAVVFIMTLTAVFSQQIVNKKLETSINHYGSSLANFTSLQAMDATLQHDLVSLQVILRDITEHPNVLNATIHDIENNLLAQAGDSLSRVDQSSYRNFNATITLHDSIAGYVTVTVDISNSLFAPQLYWLFLLTTVLIIGLIVATFYRVRKYVGIKKTETTDDDYRVDRQPENPTPDPLNDSAATNNGLISDETTRILAGNRIVLELRFNNLQLLNKQLSVSRFKALQITFNNYLRGALPLYNGELVQMDLNSAVICFDSVESQEHSAFHACCCATLLALLCEQHADIKIEFFGIIRAADVEQTDLSKTQNLEPGVDLLATDPPTPTSQYTEKFGLLLHRSLTENSDLTAKLQLNIPIDDNNKDYQEVTAIADPYHQLIQKQSQKLQQSRTSGLPIYGTSH